MSLFCSICLLAGFRALLSPFRYICLLATLSGFVVSFPLYPSSCRPIRLYCLLPALSVSLPPYQALLSPFRSICLLAALSGFIVSFPLYLLSCRPIRLCCLLSALSVFLLPYHALLSPSHFIWLNCNALILTPLVFFFLSLQACRSASIPLYLSSCRPLRLYCLLPALSVFLPPYQAFLSPFRSICLLAALSGFIVFFPL